MRKLKEKEIKKNLTHTNNRMHKRTPDLMMYQKTGYCKELIVFTVQINTF